MQSINLLLKERDKKNLSPLVNSLSGFEIASIISKKNHEDQLFLFSMLNSELAAETFDYLSHRVQRNILKSLPSSQIASMLKAMPPDDRTGLLEVLPRTVVNEYMKLIPKDEAITALKLLAYPEDTVGRLMTTDYLSVKMNWTIQMVLDLIRDYGHDSETINLIYVVDDNNVLLDDIELKQFLFCPTDYKVAQLADYKFLSLSPTDHAEQVINIFQSQSRVALPVIDDKGVLIGIVTIDDILSYSSEKNTENIQMVGGTEALDEPYMEIPFFPLMKKRAQWLVLLFLGEMLTATALAYFEDEIAKAVVLALFLPLIISSGGNAGSQSTTLIIRAMALGEVKLYHWWRIMKKEIISGFFLGLILGIIGFLRISIWSFFSNIYGEHWILIGITIFLALIGVVLWGSLAGAMLPFLLRRLKFDPAVASAPLVASVVDVTGIMIYFSIAMFVLKSTLLA